MIRKCLLGVFLLIASIKPLDGFWHEPSSCNWTGFYIGANLGGCDHTFSIFDIDYDWFGGTQDLHNQCFLGGLQFGYNYQLCRAVVGLEASFDWVNTNHSLREYSRTNTGGHEVNISAKLERFATIHTRLGIDFKGFLFYFLGGAAYEKTSGSWIELDDQPDSWPDLGKHLWGWTFGGGVEKSITSHLSFKAQVMSLRFFEFTKTNNAPTFFDTFGNRLKINNDTLVGIIGINYRFCL